MVSLDNILSSIALVFAIVFGLFAFFFSFISLSQSLDDTKRTSEQDNAMFSLAYQFVSFYHLVLTIDSENADQDRIIVQQLADIKQDLHKCVNLRLWNEIRGENPEFFYHFLKICMICDQKIESRTEDFAFFGIMMNEEGGLHAFCNKFLRYVAKLVYDYNREAQDRYSKPVFNVIHFVNGIFSIKRCILSYDTILDDMSPLIHIVE